MKIDACRTAVTDATRRLRSGHAPEDRDMVHVDTAFEQQLFDIAVDAL
jgi:hypothetical protein